MRRYAFLALIGALVVVPNAFAADADAAAAKLTRRFSLVLPSGDTLAAAGANEDATVARITARQTKESRFDGRRPALLALHAVTGIVQLYDGISTLKVLHAGGYEANPLMRGAANDHRVLVATKIGAAGAIMVATENLWRGRHRSAAVIVAVLANSAMFAVANHNSQVLKRFQAQ